MRCKKVRYLLASYLDGEANEKEREVIAKHLSGCQGCREEREDLAFLQRKVTYALKETVAERNCPDDMWARVQQRLPGGRKAEVATSSLASRMRGGIETLGERLLRQPAWKTATIGVLALVLFFGAMLGPPAVAEFFSMRRLQEIARNCPEVQAFFGEEVDIWASPVWLDRVRDGISKVVIRGFPAMNREDRVVWWCVMERQTLLATVDLRKEKIIEVREIGHDEWREFAIVGAWPRRPLPTISLEELRGKTHGEVLQSIAPVFLERVPLAIQEKLFTIRFDPDPPEALGEHPKRTYDPGRSYPRVVRPGAWSEIQFVSKERPGWGRGVGALAGTGIGWPPPPCEKLVITYLMFEGRVISFSWTYSSKTLNRYGIFLGVDACTDATITESGKVWAKGLHFVRHGDEIEVTITNSDAVFVEVVYPTMPRITPDQEGKAIAIAKAHSMVQEFLGKGAYVAWVDYTPPQDEKGVWYVPCTDRVNVNMRLVETPPVPPIERDWWVSVNLAEERMESILETKIISKTGVEAGRKYVIAIEIVETYLYPEIREVRRHYHPLEPRREDWLRTEEDVYFCETRGTYFCKTTGETVWPTADPGIWTEDRIWPMREDTVRP
ncbi:zf-HC2 domain-containing protein [Dehalococcoidia bacterium]|nr:zf-HC2 domain-containing protein [Dehalococcoidia bacterium]